MVNGNEEKEPKKPLYMCPEPMGPIQTLSRPVTRPVSHLGLGLGFGFLTSFVLSKICAISHTVLGYLHPCLIKNFQKNLYKCANYFLGIFLTNLDVFIRQVLVKKNEEITCSLVNLIPFYFMKNLVKNLQKFVNSLAIIF
jgi:hypothetical protein